MPLFLLLSFVRTDISVAEAQVLAELPRKHAHGSI